jgi:integrase/recombinase XerD
MAAMRQKPLTALDDCMHEKFQRMQDLLPKVERAQELMRQLDNSMRPLIEAAQQHQDLFREVSESPKLTGPALEATRSLTAVSDTMKDARRLDTSILDISKTIAAQMHTAPAIKEALQVDGAALDAVKNLTSAGDAIKDMMRVDTSAFALTKALAAQADTVAAMKAALQIDTSALDWPKTIAPQFEATRPLVTALQRAIPEFPKFELSPDVQEAIKSLSAMNIAPQLAAALEPPAGFAALLRDAIARGTSFAVPTALLEAQRAAAAIAPSIRLSDLTPERFGIAFVEGQAEAAWLRLMARAEGIAADEAVASEAVLALAQDADAVTAAVASEARGRLALLIEMLILTLIVDLLKDGLKAGVSALLPYLVALPLSFQPPIPPALPPAPAPFRALALPQAPGGPSGIPRGWELEGLPPIIRRAGPEAERRTVEFFESVIGNRNTRQAYAQAVMRFMTWCEDRNLELGDITVFTVTAYAVEMSRENSARTVRQHLGAIRRLFDHLLSGNVVLVNPASPVRSPKDETPKTKPQAGVLQPQEIRLLLDSIAPNDCAGLRDRALIAAMAYGFARVSAVVMMDVRDSIDRNGQRCLRLRDRNGAHEVPLHPKAKAYLDAYLKAAAIGDEPDSPLWRTMTKERRFGGGRLSRVDVFRMVKRRLRGAGLPDSANCDSIRAAGIASYIANGGTLARASVKMQPGDEITPAEIDRIGI